MFNVGLTRRPGLAIKVVTHFSKYDKQKTSVTSFKYCYVTLPLFLLKTGFCSDRGERERAGNLPCLNSKALQPHLGHTETTLTIKPRVNPSALSVCERVLTIRNHDVAACRFGSKH